MRPEAVLPLVATVISAEFTLALVRRWRVSRRPYLRSWAISLALFAVGSGALWYGTAFGWSGVSFRTYYVAGALLAVPWLAQGEVELLARPAVARVLLAFLVLFSLDAAIVLAAVPFVDGQVVSGFAVPHGKDLYPVLPRVLVAVSNGVGTVVVLGGTLWSWRKARLAGVAARARFRGTLLIMVGVVVAGVGGGLSFLGEANGLSLCLAVAAAVMYAGFVLASRRPGAHAAR